MNDNITLWKTFIEKEREKISAKPDTDIWSATWKGKEFLELYKYASIGIEYMEMLEKLKNYKDGV